MEDKMHSFETERLTIRLLEQGDRDFFVSLYTDPQIMRHIGEPLTEERANSSFKTAIKLNIETPIKQLLWGIIDKSSREICGIQNLSMHYEDIRMAEAGLILARNVQGKLYPEEALVGLVNYGFTQLGLSSIYAYSSVRNRASKRVVTKAGFHQFDENENKISFKIESE